MTDEPRRLVNADVIRMQHELALAQAARHSEPWVTVEITDAAKGEVRVITKVSVPLSADMGEVEVQAQGAVRVAVNAHEANTARRAPDDSPAPDYKAVAGIVARNARAKAARENA